MDDLRTALRRELAANFDVRQVFDDDTSLFSTGIVDSLGVMDLVGFVERHTGQPVSPVDVTMENFDSVSRIVRFIEKTSSHP